jgi:hypothetical protein
MTEPSFSSSQGFPVRLLAVFFIPLLVGCQSFASFAPAAPAALKSDVAFVCLAHPLSCGYPSAPSAVRSVRSVRVTEGDHARP